MKVQNTFITLFSEFKNYSPYYNVRKNFCYKKHNFKLAKIRQTDYKLVYVPFGKLEVNFNRIIGLWRERALPHIDMYADPASLAKFASPKRA